MPGRVGPVWLTCVYCEFSAALELAWVFLGWEWAERGDGGAGWPGTRNPWWVSDSWDEQSEDRAWRGGKLVAEAHPGRGAGGRRAPRGRWGGFSVVPGRRLQLRSVILVPFRRLEEVDCTEPASPDTTGRVDT